MCWAAVIDSRYAVDDPRNKIENTGTVCGSPIERDGIILIPVEIGGGTEEVEIEAHRLYIAKS